MTDPLKQRVSRIFERDENDWYVEEIWCSQRLFEAERFEGSVIDPFAGMGRVVRGAEAAGVEVVGMDIADREFPHVAPGHDFTSKFWSPRGLPGAPCDNIVSNPPFAPAEDMLRLALARARRKVAFLLPATWHCGDKRSRWLETLPLRRVYWLTPRPSMLSGPAILAGEKIGGGTKDFAWFVFAQGYDGRPEVCWLHRDGMLP